MCMASFKKGDFNTPLQPLPLFLSLCVFMSICLPVCLLVHKTSQKRQIYLAVTHKAISCNQQHLSTRRRLWLRLGMSLNTVPNRTHWGSTRTGSSPPQQEGERSMRNPTVCPRPRCGVGWPGVTGRCCPHTGSGTPGHSCWSSLALLWQPQTAARRRVGAWWPADNSTTSM